MGLLWQSIVLLRETYICGPSLGFCTTDSHRGVMLMGFTSALCITLKRILSSPNGVCTREPWSRWLEVGTEWFHRSSCTSSSWSCVERVHRAPGTSMPNVKYRTNLVIYKDVGSLGGYLPSFFLWKMSFFGIGHPFCLLEKSNHDWKRSQETLTDSGSFKFEVHSAFSKD